MFFRGIFSPLPGYTGRSPNFRAFLNLPITQGVKLQTKNDGRAEVEFEDGSTLRITPDTAIEFPQLSLRDSGAKVSAVHLQEGTAYVNFAGAKLPPDQALEKCSFLTIHSI
jgi:hypothetical protein